MTTPRLKRKSQRTFDFESEYPDTPGYKTGGTSQEAAELVSTRTPTLRSMCLRALTRDALTSDQVADVLGKTYFAIRPRISELSLMGLIEDTGHRRPNNSGHMAIVWAAKIS